MSNFPLHASLDSDVSVSIELPYTTMAARVASAQSTLFLSPLEQDRLRVLLEVPGRSCDEVLDDEEDEPERTRCVLRPAYLTLVQGVHSVTLRGLTPRATLLQILRMNTVCAEPDDDIDQAYG